MIEESFFKTEYVLPEPRPGMTWGFHLYPGGRKEIRQCLPERVQPIAAALDTVRSGKMAVVKPEMAKMLITWQLAEGVQREELGL